jgi:hypothetical protein
MAASEADELAGELYLVPPARFVAARDELIRTARAAGNRELAGALQGLRRPTQSAWLVNLLTRHEPDAVQRLRGLGRELRRAQTQLDGAGLRTLSAQRQELIADLLDRARRLAAEAGFRPTDAVVSEVEATLYAALVDLAASSMVLSGRLVRPMAHSGFGPMPHVDAPPVVELRTPQPAVPEREPPQPAAPTAGAGPTPHLRAAPEPTSGTDRGPAPDPRHPPSTAPVAGVPEATGAGVPEASSIAAAEAALAAAASLHWQREHELADAEGALEAARDRLEWLEQQRMEARRDKVTAERHVAEAKAAQRAAVRAVAEARRALDAAEHPRRFSGTRPPAGHAEY